MSYGNRIWYILPLTHQIYSSEIEEIRLNCFNPDVAGYHRIIIWIFRVRTDFYELLVLAHRR